jgi:hypothetical protein
MMTEKEASRMARAAAVEAVKDLRRFHNARVKAHPEEIPVVGGSIKAPGRVRASDPHVKALAEKLVDQLRKRGLITSGPANG